jgi:nicotinamide mononucleotide transporter
MSLVAGFALTTVSLALTHFFDASYVISSLEFWAVVTSYSCTILCVLQSRWNYPIGAVSTILYSILFYEQGLYSSMILNIYLPVILIYGWFRWGKDDVTRPVSWTKPKMWLFTWSLGAFVCIGLSLAMNYWFHATMALWDATILILSIMAQFLLDNKKLENWIVWGAVNVIAIYVYGEQHLYAVTIQYGLFLLNSVVGFMAWHRTMEQVSPK